MEASVQLDADSPSLLLQALLGPSYLPKWDHKHRQGVQRNEAIEGQGCYYDPRNTGHCIPRLMGEPENVPFYRISVAQLLYTGLVG